MRFCILWRDRGGCVHEISIYGGLIFVGCKLGDGGAIDYWVFLLMVCGLELGGCAIDSMGLICMLGGWGELVIGDLVSVMLNILKCA